MSAQCKPSLFLCLRVFLRDMSNCFMTVPARRRETSVVQGQSAGKDSGNGGDDLDAPGFECRQNRLQIDLFHADGVALGVSLQDR